MLIYRDYYHSEGTRDICHGVKQTENEDLRERAVNEIAYYLIESGIADRNTVLVPAPQHTGRADYTLRIAKIISEITGAGIADILWCRPHIPLYDLKMDGIIPEKWGEMYLSRIPDDNKVYLFVDNVIATGQTYLAARDLFKGNLLPFVYAVDYSVLRTGLLKGLSVRNYEVNDNANGSLYLTKAEKGEFYHDGIYK